MTDWIWECEECGYIVYHLMRRCPDCGLPMKRKDEAQEIKKYQQGDHHE